MSGVPRFAPDVEIVVRGSICEEAWVRCIHECAAEASRALGRAPAFGVTLVARPAWPQAGRRWEVTVADRSAAGEPPSTCEGGDVATTVREAFCDLVAARRRVAALACPWRACAHG